MYGLSPPVPFHQLPIPGNPSPERGPQNKSPVIDSMNYDDVRLSSPSFSARGHDHIPRRMPPSDMHNTPGFRKLTGPCSPPQSDRPLPSLPAFDSYSIPDRPSLAERHLLSPPSFEGYSVPDRHLLSDRPILPSLDGLNFPDRPPLPERPAPQSDTYTQLFPPGRVLIPPPSFDAYCERTYDAHLGTPGPAPAMPDPFAKLEIPHDDFLHEAVIELHQSAVSIPPPSFPPVTTTPLPSGPPQSTTPDIIHPYAPPPEPTPFERPKSLSESQCSNEAPLPMHAVIDREFSTNSERGSLARYTEEFRVVESSVLREITVDSSNVPRTSMNQVVSHGHPEFSPCHYLELKYNGDSRPSPRVSAGSKFADDIVQLQLHPPHESSDLYPVVYGLCEGNEKQEEVHKVLKDLEGFMNDQVKTIVQSILTEAQRRQLGTLSLQQISKDDEESPSSENTRSTRSHKSTSSKGMPKFQDDRKAPPKKASKPLQVDQKSLERKLADVRTKNKDLEQKLEALDRREGEWQRKVDDLERERNTFRATVDKLRGEIERHKLHPPKETPEIRPLDTRGDRDRIAFLEQRNKELAEALGHSQHDSNIRFGELEMLRSAHDRAAEQWDIERESAIKEMGDLRTALADRDRQIAATGTQAEELRWLKLRVAEQQEEIQRLRVQEKGMEKTIQAMQQQLADANRKFQELEQPRTQVRSPQVHHNDNQLLMEIERLRAKDNQNQKELYEMRSLLRMSPVPVNTVPSSPFHSPQHPNHVQPTYAHVPSPTAPQSIRAPPSPVPLASPMKSPKTPVHKAKGGASRK